MALRTKKNKEGPRIGIFPEVEHYQQAVSAARAHGDDAMVY